MDQSIYLASSNIRADHKVGRSSFKCRDFAKYSDRSLFFANTSNVLVKGLEEEEALNASGPYFWQTIHIFGKAPRVTKKLSPWAPKMIFFCPDLFFFSGSNTRALCRKKAVYRESPPCSIFHHPSNREI